MSVTTNELSVLIVDDDPIQRRVLGEFFARRAWQFDEVESGDHAIEAATHQSYDLIITDLMMPGISGLGLLKQLKNLKPAQAIIVVSGSRPVQDAAIFFREGGAVDFLEKPIDLDLLELSVTRVVSSARQEAFESTICTHLLEETATYSFSSSDLAATHFPFSILDSLFAAACFDRNTRLRLELACQEALANSLEHGNLELRSEWKEVVDEEGRDQFSRIKQERLMDPVYSNRRITVSWRYQQDVVEIDIVDEGAGFDFQKNGRNDSEAGQASLAVHGRGLSIMEGIMDEVRYSEQGRRINMKKELPSPLGTDKE